MTAAEGRAERVRALAEEAVQGFHERDQGSIDEAALLAHDALVDLDHEKFGHLLPATGHELVRLIAMTIDDAIEDGILALAPPEPDPDQGVVPERVGIDHVSGLESLDLDRATHFARALSCFQKIPPLSVTQMRRGLNQADAAHLWGMLANLAQYEDVPQEPDGDADESVAERVARIVTDTRNGTLPPTTHDFNWLIARASLSASLAALHRGVAALRHDAERYANAVEESLAGWPVEKDDREMRAVQIALGELEGHLRALAPSEEGTP